MVAASKFKESDDGRRAAPCGHLGEDGVKGPARVGRSGGIGGKQAIPEVRVGSPVRDASRDGASERNRGRLNPKDEGMMPMMCNPMDALEEIFEERPYEVRRAPREMPRVLLASQSPRRRKLLAENGIDHTAVMPGVDDSELVRGGVTPAEWVAALAYFKAAAARDRLHPCETIPGELVILGADTVVRKGDKVIGQPVDAADAEKIIRTLSSGEHEVLTGVAFVDAATGRRDMWVDRSTVRVGEIGDERICEYVASGDWRGKAGGYNLSERLAAAWPIEFEGDPGTIMGLPMRRLGERLLWFRDVCVGADQN